MNKLLFVLCALIVSVSALANGNPDGLIGVWKNGSGKGHIKISKVNGRYYGTVIWLKNATDATGKPKVDKRNPNPALRNKPLVGLVMLKDFVYDKNDERWEDGRIYNPGDGKEYKAYIKMENNNTLTVRGYMGLTWIGKSDTWVRVS